eukprot:TRINITY_DN9641_c0_g1_i2.p1 TRINITY_DN9641_c0_g1~~TRINITY_DN9641_c0_g1_i2.p1  ORF type:complete len:236 (-),score=-22.93 TRINITY_DN9641_c0_g1_i2:66-773(-)
MTTMQMHKLLYENTFLTILPQKKKRRYLYTNLRTTQYLNYQQSKNQVLNKETYNILKLLLTKITPHLPFNRTCKLGIIPHIFHVLYSHTIYTSYIYTFYLQKYVQGITLFYSIFPNTHSTQPQQKILQKSKKTKIRLQPPIKHANIEYEKWPKRIPRILKTTQPLYRFYQPCEKQDKKTSRKVKIRFVYLIMQKTLKIISRKYCETNISSANSFQPQSGRDKAFELIMGQYQRQE